MSTTPRSFFFVLPLMATALLAPAAFGESHTAADQQRPTIAPKPPRAQAVHPAKPAQRHHHHHGKRHAKHHRHHGHHHHHHHQYPAHTQMTLRPANVQEYHAVQSYRRLRAMPAPRPHCCPYARALDPVVFVPKINPLAPSPCPPDFADRWLADARLAWVGPTRYFPFQPNGFYPSPGFSNIRSVPAEAYNSDAEIIGGGGNDFGK